MTTKTFAARLVRSARSICSLLAAGLTLGAMAVSASAGVSTTYEPGQAVGTINSSSIFEASGLVAGHNTPGTLWTHNDSGDTPRIFAIDTQGRLLANYALQNKNHVDYEDIARGPGPSNGVNYLYVGDIGDNATVRSPSLLPITVYRFPEPYPQLAWASSPSAFFIPTGSIAALTFGYPDGAHNAEALWVDPISGDLFIATKVSGSTAIYTAAASSLIPGPAITLSLVTTIPLAGSNKVTGGDIAPDGSAIILRGTNFALLWERGAGQTVAQALGGTAVAVPVANEPQGEAICFADDGVGYYTLSEETSQPLYYYAPINTPACAADFNNTNGVTVQDIFDFLTAWLGGNETADFNAVNGVTVQDIFDFLTAWLAGC